MLLIHKKHVLFVPLVPLTMVVLLTLLLWQYGERFVGRPFEYVATLMVFIILMAFLTMAIATACWLERRGEQIYWAQLWRHATAQAEECVIKTHAWKARYAYVEICFLVRGTSVVTIGLNDSSRARAKAKQVAEALRLPFVPASDGVLPTRGGRVTRKQRRRGTR
jgi:amino acid permease